MFCQLRNSMDRTTFLSNKLFSSPESVKQQQATYSFTNKSLSLEYKILYFLLFPGIL